MSHRGVRTAMRARGLHAGRIGLAVLAAALGVLVGAAPTRAAAPPASAGLPMGLMDSDGAQQLIVVTSTSERSSVATLRAFAEVNGVWRQAFGPIRARVGRNGWRAAARRREGDGTTPEGIYSIGATMYGTRANPGVAYPYHRLMPGDFWDENPATGRKYNTFHHSARASCARNPYGGHSECLWRASTAYAYFAVVNFNTPPTGPYGSGIFLHVGTRVATSGCVSIAPASLVRLLDWLRPADTPCIVLAGPTPLARY